MQTTLNKKAHSIAMSSTIVQGINKQIVSHTNSLKALPRQSGKGFNYHNSALTSLYAQLITISNN